MVRILASLAVLLSAADHWTTYLCLRNPVQGWNVTEANPFSGWLFASIGLVPGLLLDSAVTLFAVFFVVTTQRLPAPLKGAFFSIFACITAYAVINNFRAIETLGISSLGLG